MTREELVKGEGKRACKQLRAPTSVGNRTDMPFHHTRSWQQVVNIPIQPWQGVAANRGCELGRARCSCRGHYGRWMKDARDDGGKVLDLMAPITRVEDSRR
jgi:hypothetical protein